MESGILMTAVLIMGGLGALLSGGLALADKTLKVDEDERISLIESLLPGVQCGSCGYPGCKGFAEALVKGDAPVNGCRVMDNSVIEKISHILGKDVEVRIPKVCVVKCQGGNAECKNRSIYHGIEDCRASLLIAGGEKGCTYGCIGLGSCVGVCPFGAISMSENGLPVVLKNKCSGCGICVKTCPRGVLEVIDNSNKSYVACLNKDKGKEVKELCSKGCFTCMICASKNVSPSGMIIIKDNLPVINWQKQSEDWKAAAGKCLNKCFVVRG